MRGIAIVGVVPLLIIGAILGPAVWREIDLHFALQPSVSQPKNPSIIMLGDSHTQIPNWLRLTGCNSIANFGIGGNTSAQMLYRLKPVIDAAPKAVFVMAGTNDAPAGVNTQLNISRIRAELRSKGIVVFVQTPPPRAVGPQPTVAAADIVIPFDLADLLPDGTHLRRSGYAKWRDAIALDVNRYCAS